jgi:hypothetical protein
MSKLQEISGELIEISSISPDLRNNALSDLAKKIQGLDDYHIIPEQKSLIVSIIESLISENDAEQIAKSKLVFVQDVEEQIAPTKKTRAKKVVKPVTESTLEDLPDDIGQFPILSTLPEPIIRLAGLRRKEQGMTGIVYMGETLSTLFDWNITPEGTKFWYKISNDGDLTEFKKLYGNKGEKVDEIIEFSELTEFVEGLSKNQTELPDTIQKQPQIKDLPDAIKKLVIFRNKQEGSSPNFDLNDTIQFAFNWQDTPEGDSFWALINDLGDLTEFKKLYGNKGEKVDDIIEMAELNEFVESLTENQTPAPAPVVKTRKTRKPRTPKAPAPVITTQEVNAVYLVVYPPKGGVVELKTESLYELHDISKFVINKLGIKTLRLNFNVITDLGTYTSQINFSLYYSQDDLIRVLIEQFDTFVKPELDWKNFEEKKPIFAPAPKPVAKAKTTSVKPETKITSVKPEAKRKQKQVTKPKAKSDLSFLDDLDNIL